MAQTNFGTLSPAGRQVWSAALLREAQKGKNRFMSGIIDALAREGRDRALDEMVADQVEAIEAALNAMMLSVALKKWDALVLTLGLHGIEPNDEGLAGWPDVKDLKRQLRGLEAVREQILTRLGA